VRAIVLEHIARELGADVDLAAYDNAASLHAAMARQANMSLAQYQALAVKTLTQALRSGGADLPTLLRTVENTPPPADAKSSSPRLTRPRPRRLK
jgi:hypothetical protein